MVIKLLIKNYGNHSYAISPQFQSNFLPDFSNLAAMLENLILCNE